MDLYFTQGADLTDRDTLVKAAADVGLDAKKVREALASDQDVAADRTEALSAKEAGIEGVPCFIFGGKFAVSGAQSPEYLAEAIDRVASGNRATLRSNYAALAGAAIEASLRKIAAVPFRRSSGRSQSSKNTSCWPLASFGSLRMRTVEPCSRI